MISIQILCVGKMKEKFFKDAFEEYQKRLSKYCNFSVIEVSDEKIPDKVNEKIIDDIKQKECQKLLNHIKKGSYTIALDLSGKEYSSENFSKKIETIALNNSSSITFIIGGSLGLTNDLLVSCDEKICFSKMTFPHQLIRIFLAEQIFRSFKIIKGETYHR